MLCVMVAGRDGGTGGRSGAAEGLAWQGGLFVSYSHPDRHWLRRFVVMLAPLARNRGIRFWADEHIWVGDDWHRAIQDAVGRAGVALLLVSPDFLASRFIVKRSCPP